MQCNTAMFQKLARDIPFIDELLGFRCQILWQHISCVTDYPFSGYIVVSVDSLARYSQLACATNYQIMGRLLPNAPVFM